MIELTEDLWQWIDDNAKSDPNKLRLAYHGDPERLFAIDQIDARQRGAIKHRDTLLRAPRFIFDSTLAVQQSTSDLLARFHSSLTASGQSVLDMTGGLGIDALYLSDVASEVTVIEINPDRLECARQNFNAIGKQNITTICGDSVELLKIMDSDSFDVIFIDPARRGDHGKRLFALSDCTPDVVKLLPEMLKVAPKVIIKCSPMLDVTQVMRELIGIERIVILGTITECKEMIIICGRNITNSKSIIEAITLNDQSVNRYVVEPERDSEITESYSHPVEGMILYDPYPSFAKLNYYGHVFPEVRKIAPFTNLFVSEMMSGEFPGRAYNILDVMAFNKSAIRKIANCYPEASVTTKNFTMKAPELQKRLKLKHGNEIRVFGTTDNDGNKILIIAKPVTSQTFEP